LARISHRLSAANTYLTPSQDLPLRAVLNVLSSTLPLIALREARELARLKFAERTSSGSSSRLDLTQSTCSRYETRQEMRAS